MDDISSLVSTLSAKLDLWFPYPQGATLAIAVSGGADSLALAFLLQAWARSRQTHIIALHVDHRLRPESTQEAHRVFTWLKDKGIACEVLSWVHDPLKGRIQETARAKRYELLLQRCHALNIHHLFLAHHLDDQIETWMMRAFKGSGLKGLRAMDAKLMKHGIWCLRPLLDVPKASLVHFLKDHPYISDPSNQNEIYERIRMRNFLKESQKFGISLEALTKSIHRLTLADQALESLTESLFQTHIHCHPLGYFSLDPKVLQGYPLEVRHRLIQRLLQALSPVSQAPRFKILKKIEAFIRNPSVCLTAGKVLWQFKKGQILVSKEPAYVAFAQEIKNLQDFLWDERFLIDNIMEKAIYSKVEIGMLGNHGLSILRNHGFDFEGFHAIYKTIPGVWCQKHLLSCPLLGFNSQIGQEFLRMRFLPFPHEEV